MFGFFRWSSTIVKCSIQKFPTSVNRININCRRILQPKNVHIGSKEKPPSQPSAQNEIIVYKIDNLRFFSTLNILSGLNYSVWLLLAISTYQLVLQVSEGDNSSQNLWIGDQISPQTIIKIIIVTQVLGALLVLSVWLYTLKYITSIKLLKESKNVLFETYTPICTVRKFSAPLNEVSGVISRHKAKGYIPLKIKGKIFYYLVDVNGKFSNHVLFDSTIALKRNFNK